MFNVYLTDVCNVPSDIPPAHKILLQRFTTHDEADMFLNTKVQMEPRKSPHERLIGNPSGDYCIDFGSWNRFYVLAEEN